MARTYRNKSSLPVGWTVRDDGRPYFHGDDPWGLENEVAVPKYRRSHYRCESGENRQKTNQEYRARTNLQVRTGRWEDVLPFTRTSGWETW